MNDKIIDLSQHPELARQAVVWFAGKWGIPEAEYQKSFADMYAQKGPLPKWYAILDEDQTIIAGCGLIQNDFVDRTDLYPYLCALFVEPRARGRALGGRLLAHARADAGKNGFSKLYLCTNHISYYERYGWKYLCVGHHQDGDTSRVYEADVL